MALVDVRLGHLLLICIFRPKMVLHNHQPIIVFFLWEGTELVTTLKRQATELLSKLERNKEPILITQHGVPTGYLVDVETYKALQRQIILLEGIARGENAVEEGRTLTHAHGKKRMKRWLK